MLLASSNCAILEFEANFEVVLWPSGVFFFFELYKIYIFQTAFIFAPHNTISFSSRTKFLKKKIAAQKYSSFPNFGYFSDNLGVLVNDAKAL